MNDLFYLVCNVVVFFHFALTGLAINFNGLVACFNFYITIFIHLACNITVLCFCIAIFGLDFFITILCLVFISIFLYNPLSVVGF